MSRRQTLKRSLGLFAAIAVAGATVGCGTQLREPEAGGEAATITYWSAWNEGEAQQKIFETVREAFTAETGIEIEVEYLGRQVTTTLVNALGTGTGPDLFDAGSRNLRDYEQRGFLADMSDLMKTTIPGEDNTVEESFSAAVLSAASGEKGVGILPTYVNSNAIWFNAAAHPEIDKNPPETWEEFIAVLDAEKAAGRVPLGADGTVPGYNVFWFYQSMMQTSGPGSLRALAEDAANWDAPEVLQSAQMVQQIVDGGYLQADYMGTKYPDAQNRWAQNEYSFILGGSYLEGETRAQQASGFTARTILFPTVDGNERTMEATASGLAANADSKNLDAVKQFLAFAAKKEYQELYSTEAGFIAARQDVTPPETLETLVDAIADATSTTQTYDLAGALHSAWWNDVLLPLNDQLFSGAIDAEQFVALGKEQTAAHISANS